ncbi:uncharacterized protein LOC123223817 isoform X2 [Mangifera indica]|uniref:uncharacterized protein LOC123223817 isoform X2 n=1 Tax=Mangifera indica TaxID=29780 RepID=UPI001CFC277B|nr:uncharacterized protein LOC123223817 isoform X2 [Mangifera indica]
MDLKFRFKQSSYLWWRKVLAYSRYYICRKTGQRFYTYEDMMHYVKYAKEAGLPVYFPNFDFRKKKKSGLSLESAPYQIEESLDSGEESDTEKSLDSEKDDSDTDKIMDLEKAVDIKMILDSEKDTGPGKSEFLKNDPIENMAASLLDSLPSISEFIAYPQSMQISSEQVPVVEIPTSVPDTLPSGSGLNAEQEPMQISSEQAPVVEFKTYHRRIIRKQAPNMEFKTRLCRIDHRRRRINREQAPVEQITRSHPYASPRIIEFAVPRTNPRIMKRSHLCPKPHKPQLLRRDPGII